MSQTFTYTFTTIVAPTPETITFTVPDNPQLVYLGNETAYGYPIQSVSGMFNGGTITGLVGVGTYGVTGSPDDYLRTDPATLKTYDNVIFINNQNGDAGSSFDGVDSDGIDFTEGSTTYNLYSYSFHFQDYSSPQSAADPYYGTPMQDTPVDNPAMRVVLVTTDAPCYVEGTRIRVARSRDGAEEIVDVAVESLAVGDLAVTVSGARRPIRWLGHRTIGCRAHPRPHEVMPVRIAAHAFGDARPASDLYLSPGHSICLDIVGEVLIPAATLVNGATVTQLDVDEVTYWHVELESHDILIAENMPAESYLDMGNRGFFIESDVVELDRSPDAALSSGQATHDDFCRPVHVGGAMVDAVRSRLRHRAEALGWRIVGDPFADLHLVVDGVRIAPTLRDLRAGFVLPAEASEIWLVSGTTRPCDIAESADCRRLGVPVRAIEVGDIFERRAVPLDDPRLGSELGFHAREGEQGGTWRWTAGHTRLPASLWDGLGGPLTLHLELAGPALPRWQETTPDAKLRVIDRRAHS